MVAINRCMTFSNFGNSNFLSSKRNQIIIIIFLRIYGFVITLPSALGVSNIAIYDFFILLVDYFHLVSSDNFFNVKVVWCLSFPRCLENWDMIVKRNVVSSFLL